MIAVLLAATLSTQADLPDVTTFGRDLFTSAACASLGWNVDQAEITRLGLAIDAAHPDMTPDALARVAGDAAGLGQEEMAAEIQALASRTDARAWLAAMETRCDALAAARPGLLSRAAGPASGESDLRSRFLARYPE